MTIKFLLVLAVVSVMAVATSCNRYDSANANNANANATAQTTTQPGADNSEITTTTDASGVTTQTRVFRNNPRISKVVVTTRDGRRTAKAYSPSGEEREITDVDDALVATGETIASGAGFVADKAEDAGGEAKDVAGEAKDVGQKVGEKTVDTAEKVGEKTVEGTKKVTKKTTDAAKKAGKAIKDVVP